MIANSPSSPFQVTVTANGRPLLMEIDTGASVSIASLAHIRVTIRYKPGKANANVDALSRLPLPAKEYDVPKPAELVQLLEHLSTTPVSSSQVKTWTDTDPVLAKVRRWVEEGWPEQNPASDADQELSSYFRRRWELGVEGRCVLWGVGLWYR